MKKLIYTMIVSCLFFGLGSCDQEIDYPYEGKDRIYFDCFTFNSYTRIRTYTDSLTFSFGLIADSIRIDTARIVLHYSGTGAYIPCKSRTGFDYSRRRDSLPTHPKRTGFQAGPIDRYAENRSST